jgi:hypothetical protein
LTEENNSVFEFNVLALEAVPISKSFLELRVFAFDHLVLTVLIEGLVELLLELMGAVGLLDDPGV